MTCRLHLVLLGFTVILNVSGTLIVGALVLPEC